jgi:hypothetical protein
MSIKAYKIISVQMIASILQAKRCDNFIGEMSTNISDINITGIISSLIRPTMSDPNQKGYFLGKTHIKI